MAIEGGCRCGAVRHTLAHHFGAESIHEAWLDTHDLPRYRTDEHKPLVDRWMASVGKLPD